MKPRIITEFTGNPWEGVDMPKGFDPEKNEFLNPKLRKKQRDPDAPRTGIEDAVKVVEGVKRYYKFNDGLPVFKEDSRGNDAYKSEHCAWYGLLLHAAGYKAEAQAVVDKIKELPLYRDDGLVAGISSTSQIVNENVDSLSNAVWGLLLTATEDFEDVVKVIDSVRDLGKLYYDNGLVNEFVLPNGSTPMSASILAENNTLWGLLLNASTYSSEGLDADKVVQSIRSSGLYRDDGMLCKHSGLSKSGSGLPDPVDMYSNGLWATLLTAAGYDNESRKVSTGVINLDLMQSPLFRVDNMNEGVGAQGTCAWVLYLRSFSMPNAADQIVADIKNDDKIYTNAGIVREKPGSSLKDFYIVTNCLWGILQVSDGYKVLTGEK